MPLLLTVNGFVTPAFPAAPAPGHPCCTWNRTDIRHRQPSKIFLADRRKEHRLPTPRSSLPYPAEDYTDDLWLDNGAPQEVSTLSWMIRYYPLIGIGLYILFSALAALLAGLIVFARGSITPARLLEHGLWNCATLAGFVYATRRYLVLPDSEKKKRARFVGVFIVLFLALITAAALAFVPSFADLLPVSPLILLMVVLFGALACTEAMFPVITGQAVYLPTDGLILWGMAVAGLAVILAACVYAAYRVVRYLNGP